MEEFSHEENKARMLRGELYYAFSPLLYAERNRCHHACNRFNTAGDVPRRRLVELWREYVAFMPLFVAHLRPTSYPFNPHRYHFSPVFQLPSQLNSILCTVFEY